MQLLLIFSNFFQSSFVICFFRIIFIFKRFTFLFFQDVHWLVLDLMRLLQHIASIHYLFYWLDLLLLFVFYAIKRVYTQQTFVGFQDVLKTSSTRLQRNNFRSCKTSWRGLEDVFKTSPKTSWKTKKCYNEDVFKTSWRRLEDMSWRCLEDISWRRLQDVSETNKMFTGDICT